MARSQCEAYETMVWNEPVTRPPPFVHLEFGLVIHPHQVRFQLRTYAIHYTDHLFIHYKGEYAVNPKPCLHIAIVLLA